MNKKLLLVLPAVLAVVSCGQPKPSENPSQEPSIESSVLPSVAPSVVPSVEPSVEPSVANPSIEISGESSVFVSKTLELSAQVKDSTDTVVWTVDNEQVATINGGVLTAIAPGTVKVTASLSNNETIKDEFDVTVKDILIDATVNSTVWDYAGVYSDTPTMKTNGDQGAANIKTFAKAKNIYGKKYLAEATFDIKERADWAWNGVGITNMKSDNVSYGTIFAQNKVITQWIDPAKDYWQWNNYSDRNQIWDQNGLNALLNATSVKVTTVRNNNAFYHFVNDILVNKEEIGFNELNDVDTTPAFYALGTDVEVKNIRLTTNEEEINAALPQNNLIGKLYPSFAENVEIKESSITFKNVDNATTNVKDVAAKSIGDSMYFPANKNAKIEFDLCVEAWGSIDTCPAVNLEIKQYESASPAETRSYVITKTGVGFTGWNYNSNMPDGVGTGITNYDGNVRISEETKTYHVICHRVIIEGGSDTRLEVYDGDTKIADYKHGWNWNGYAGGCNVNFSVRNVGATLSNITLTVVDE